MSKYRKIQDAKEGELTSLEKVANQDSWKPIYHIHPPYGLMNDPNGVSYYNDEYHIFYQWYPFAPIHGMKHWGHVKSKDLIHWERMPVAITPTEDYESHGAYSGGSFVKNDILHLFYTGNVKYDDGSSNANQCLALMNNKYEIEKIAYNPIIRGVPAGYTRHVRDPKILEHNGCYYMLLGAQRSNETGTLLIYHSKNLFSWELYGELQTNLKDFGFMWECPDFFHLDGKDILVFSPQGLEGKGDSYQNVYNVIYAVGTLDLENLYFHIESYNELDKGFDFYAPQTLQDSNGRRIMFAWAGSSEISYPSDDFMWAHCLTIPRELTLEGNILKQRPVSELKELRTSSKSISGCVQNETCVLLDLLKERSYELEVQLQVEKANVFGISLFHHEEESFPITFHREKGTVSVERGNFQHRFGGEYGYTRCKQIQIQDSMSMQIFVDQSIVEVFLCDGDTVFTSRVFPRKDLESGISLFADEKMEFQITQYKLGRGLE
ncbi:MULTISPECIES: glycoside hydrolase family 32 protein [Bacillus]|jgi:beta-fructofuranosidase|uniref:Sucrose-6-phosphate hydrolase n=1 Tax=Bacillus pacificus TaxID=2026187 RepID=A0A1Y5Z9E5_9BACI|nr:MULTISPECIES: sucrose-6-phosphate hydrolase [Bacillus]KMQ26961.1 glycosyl hydrolase family 32 [Bacillus cereus]KXX95040.1 glycosyl hydrolase family 32 [Bacillus cereus]KXY91467.1 glycosyl hydrolase family 32 [Bacillus cereus]MBL3758419.1 sucrose-6-phosphate hydrolase [Bacillus cereus]MBL3794997.1 sucrose-6-phosphate hydrolase [Bacillus cereus]